MLKTKLLLALTVTCIAAFISVPSMACGSGHMKSCHCSQKCHCDSGKVCHCSKATAKKSFE